jgi:predicted GH43/DUF377 family glycosyl hydrolase
MSTMIRCVVVFSSFAMAPSAQAEDDASSRWLAPQNWKRDTAGPVLSLGPAGAFDDAHLLSPCVAKIDGRFFLWYVGSRGDVAGRVYRLGLAVSDDGRTFTRREANPVLEFTDGRRSIVTPTLLIENDGTPIREDGKLRMWFTGTDFRDPEQLHSLHEATSTDGVQWSTPSNVLLKHVYAPTILKEGDAYRLWYTDVSADPWCFRHATSHDGRTWQVDEKPVLEVGQAWESQRLFYPAVRKIDGLYVMWYGSYWSAQKQKTALGVAVSRDGRTWTRSPHNPVFRPDETRPWESHYTTSQSLMRQPDGSWRIWYACRTKPPFVHKYFALGTAVWKPAE